MREKIQPTTTKTVFLTLTTLFLLLLILSLTRYPPPIPLPSRGGHVPPLGTLSPILHDQHLSHGSFHNDVTKPYLLDLVTTHASQSVVIIGLAGGSEAIKMSRTHPVHAFEPMPHYVDRFKKRPQHTIQNVTIYPVAATSKNGQLDVKYRGIAHKVAARRAEGLLPKDVAPAVVSVDVQGAEFDALKGLGKVLDNTASVWVEVGCGKASPQAMLQFLDQRFVLFDFVPWGKRDGMEETFARDQFFAGSRPNGIADWTKWFCAAAAGDEFLWLQTDVVGVHRELLARRPDILEGLKRVAELNCERGCYFRELVAQV